MYDQGPWHLQVKFNNLFDKHFFLPGFYSKVFCRVKTGEMEMDFKVGRWWRWILKLSKVGTLLQMQ